MNSQFLRGLFCFAVLAIPSVINAQVLPFQEDASLHDVQFVGEKIGWAAGDHGVIWHTTNAGQTWDFVPCPVNCPLKSICFLTNRVGWIAGGGTTPHTRLNYGVVLYTENAGQSWKVIAKDTIPPLSYIKFFGLDEGVAVGESTQEHPTGIVTTQDGGKTWQPLEGDRLPGWRTAQFLSPEVGVVAGNLGRVKLVGNGQLLPSQAGTPGMQNLRAVHINQKYNGWVVGDGGLILQTDNGGVSWQPPKTTLPKNAENTINFRAVAAKGPKVWIAGHPGSVVWHSPDNGQTWRKQFTGQPQPISMLTFPSETNGWAVGAMGMILNTRDGGETWQVVRGGNRRVAVMAIPARPSRVPFSLLTKLSGDEGYRSTVYLPARRDVGADAVDHAHLYHQLREAVTTAGGSFAESNWRLPIAIPGLEKNRDRLLADWNLRTENKFASVFLEDLVREIRTWRPDVIILDAASQDDALTKLLNEAITRAVQQAADPTSTISLQEHAGLRPWQVRKIYQRLPENSVGDDHLDLHEYLPRLKTSLQTASTEASAKVLSITENSTTREAYRLVLDQTQQANATGLSKAFFAGLSIPPNSAARRALLPIDPALDAQRRKVMERQRNFHAYTKRMMQTPRQASQVIAQLRQVTTGLTNREAALELARLAEEYRNQSRWDLVESTLVELVERYPHEPAAHKAMRWLFQLWTAAEPAWQRAKKQSVSRGTLQTDPHAIQERINNALAKATQPQVQHAEYQRPQTGPNPVQFVANPGAMQITKDKDWRTGTVANWQQQAVQLASLIQTQSPGLFLDPNIQFPLASLMRQRGVYRLSDSYYRRYQRLGDKDQWKGVAAGELWMAQPLSEPPRPIIHCLMTSKRPKLDGVLSDPCWQAAKILTLKNPGEGASTQNTTSIDEGGFVMMSYDDQFLYVAASIPRTEHLPNEGVQLGGRTHDADLALFDRISLAIDTDRDYATWYTLEVDQRGWTSDQCWGDKAWNPKWYVAAEADETRWRIEAAIPFNELVPQTPKPGLTWAMGIVRTMPAVGNQGWPAASGSKPRPESFGLVRFH